MKTKNNSIAITAIISGVILIVALVALFAFKPATSITGVTENTVSVQGVAQIKAMPDLMAVYFNIQSDAETTSEARSLNVDKVEELVVAIVDLGFERKDIVTENFNVYENCDWKDGERECEGFTATHSIKVEVGIEDTELMGEVVDAGVNAGAMVNYINFELTQESQNKYKAEAMKLAAGDAKIKAESVAEGFDKKVGKLVNVQVNDFGYYPWRAYGGAMMAEDAAMVKESVSNIQPGEKEISASVSATYKLR